MLYLITYNKKHTWLDTMGNLSEQIGRITNLLEDAVEEQDWNLVKKMTEELDDIYNQLDRQENGYGVDYE